jgi:hypothetical protein
LTIVIADTGPLYEPGSSVSIVSGYGRGDRGSIPGRGKRVYPVASVSRPAVGPTQPPILGYLPRGKARPGRGADHSLPSSTEVMNEWELYLLSPSAFMVCSGTALPLLGPLLSNETYCSGLTK